MKFEATTPDASVLSEEVDKDCDVIFGHKGPGDLALGNPIIMSKISTFLDNRDLCRWYGSSRIFKDIIEQMDDSTWRRRTLKLAKALNMRTSHFLSFRKMFPILKDHLDVLVSRIHGPDNMCYGYDNELITAAARLAHYGYFRCETMFLDIHDLSMVPGKHLCSLASSVTDSFSIQSHRGCDLVQIIDSVKSKQLWISNQNLDKEAAEAVVRAMDTRIEEALIEYIIDRKTDGGEEDTQWRLALTKYNGKGRCWNITLTAGHGDKYKKWLRDWADTRDWIVTFEGDAILWIERRL